MNRLIHEKSPYLLQHANNPVEWYPWGEEAFLKAKQENKPVFLSIGYSTCHWCHVMAHESFEDREIAELLNQNFVSIKVDKEERPDIDSIYMSVCQAYTGGGGWPTSIFMTPEQKPFYAGTYFPKHSRGGMIGFYELLFVIADKWKTNREDFIKAGDQMIEYLKKEAHKVPNTSEELIKRAVNSLKASHDSKYGGFGNAPKFPTPHILLFLLRYYQKTNDQEALAIVEKTLTQMYRGGIFDHIGYGFSRYSTDRYYLVPHFEKMLYDNALLMMSYMQTYAVTKNALYRDIAVKIYQYVVRELQAPQGGFYSAQDADSEGVEGKYYVFGYDEIIDLLGEDVGQRFNRVYDITKKGNFEGKNIPNLLKSAINTQELEAYIPLLYEYRKKRAKLHLDDKILTSWNGLMISALVLSYRVIGEEQYLQTAKKALTFIENHLCMGSTLYVSYRDGETSKTKGFLDDYAFLIFAYLHLYEATYEEYYLQKATVLMNKVIADFYDTDHGGFFLYGNENEQLIIKPKETYDGAIPSGNSVMAYNLMMLSQLHNDEDFRSMAQAQSEFMSSYANDYPMGASFYFITLLEQIYSPKKVVCVLKDVMEKQLLINKFPLDVIVRVYEKETEEYPLLNDKTTYYLCQNFSCSPPTNEVNMILSQLK
jgi:uncharacterized protein YyaL (SSP411 family)